MHAVVLSVGRQLTTGTERTEASAEIAWLDHGMSPRGGTMKNAPRPAPITLNGHHAAEHARPGRTVAQHPRNIGRRRSAG